MRTKLLLFILIFMGMAPGLAFAKNSFSFDGQMDFLHQQLDLNVNLDQNSSVKTKIKKTSDSDYYVLLKLEHLKASVFDLSSEVESSIGITSLEDGFRKFILGKVSSHYSLLDRQPTGELSGQFEIKDNKVILSALSFGNISCNGSIEMGSPYKLDLTFNLSSVDMNHFIAFWANSKEYSSSGTVSGKIKVGGSLEQLALKGSLESLNGVIEELQYDSFILNTEGIYPHMDIASSKISQTGGGSFILNGSVDLSHTENFKKQIEHLTLSPVVNKSDSKVEWTIKRSEDDKSGATEIKYLLRKDGPAGDTNKESDMLGVQRTVSF